MQNNYLSTKCKQCCGYDFVCENKHLQYIYKNDGLDLNEVLVPVKLTVIKNNQNIEELINDISIYSNTQTAIKKSDPPSNLKFYKLFEELSKTILAKNKFQEYYCFFERTNGQYNTLKRINSKDSK